MYVHETDHAAPVEMERQRVSTQTRTAREREQQDEGLPEMLACDRKIASSCILTCSTVPQSGSVESVRRCTDFSRFPASQSAPILHFFPCIHVVAVLAKIVSHKSFAFVSSLIRVYLRRGDKADVARKQPAGANDSKIRGSA